MRKVPEIEKAVKYLAEEVPRWSRENHCFSCHNNGDAARALFEARRRGFAVPDPALADTLMFLSHPDRWDKNGVDAAFSDKRLARLQFSVALSSGIDTAVIADRSLLEVATRQLIKDQAADGSWPIDDEALIGSPATYGKPLATALAIRVLTASDRQRFAEPIRRASQWLRTRPIRNVLDACAALTLDDIAPGSRLDPKLRDASLELLRRAQCDNGGWGPFTNSSPEVFDTALVLITLAKRQDQASWKPLLERGRAYLISQQAEDGSWPETTRPSGSESYAQRLSTTGWATLALILTECADPG
ncbi:hypothetical protein [Singulisphaera sp. PoT]|uniref:hypothetical protein n=1 Tax=Singulisphaera sp. PoT TaxID=3411797 RepID=UPI003BF52861